MPIRKAACFVATSGIETRLGEDMSTSYVTALLGKIPQLCSAGPEIRGCAKLCVLVFRLKEVA